MSTNTLNPFTDRPPSELPPDAPLATVLIVSYNTREILRTCLTRLDEEIAGRNIEVIVIDNASRDQSAEMVEQDFPRHVLIRGGGNLGFAAANNLGFMRASGKYMILLNPDAFVEAGSMTRSLEHMDHTPEAGLAGGRLQDRDGVLQPSGRLFPSLFNELLVLSGLAAKHPESKLFGRFDRTWSDPSVAARVDWVPGAYTIIRREALADAGIFDERFFLYYEEVDLCRRIVMAGWEIWYWPDIVVTHLGGESSKTVKTMDFSSSGSQLTLWRLRSGMLYYRKHHGALTAWLAAHLEMYWRRLQLLRLQRSGRQPERAKALERDVACVQRAWADTRGGSVSPQRPW